MALIHSAFPLSQQATTTASRNSTFWSSTDKDGYVAYRLSLDVVYSDKSYGDYDKVMNTNSGLSVGCLRD